MSATKNSNLVKMGARGKWEDGIRSSHSIRDFASFSMDEPVNLGGTDVGGTPLEYMAATLNGCKAVMIPLIAKELDFYFSDITFETDGFVDVRGLMGDENVKTYFQYINFILEIETNESDEKLKNLKNEVEKRCPVYNLFIDAGIPVNVEWKRK